MWWPKRKSTVLYRTGTRTKVIEEDEVEKDTKHIAQSMLLERKVEE